MKKINRLLHIFFTAAAILSAGNALAIDTDTNATFAHYYGEAYAEDQTNAFNSKGYQKCPEVHYYYYVDANRSNISLNLPFENYTTRGGDMEPRGWIRWYDYNTDCVAVNLTANGSKLKAIYATENGKLVSKGFFAYDIGANPTHSNIGAIYVPPTGSESSDWEGETIACDVSRFVDYTTATYPEHEPTLSVRFIYHILPAAKLANDIMDSVTGHDVTSLTYEDNRTIDFGARLSSSPMNIRLNLISVSHYYFHPMVASYTENHHLYYPDAQASTYAIYDEHFDNTTVKQATGVEWRAYDSTKTKWTTLNANATTSVFQSVSVLGCTSTGRWKDLNGNSTTAPSIAIGDYVYVVAYLVNGTSKCPVANYKIWFKNTYPLMDDERTLGYRSDSYIENNYRKYEVTCIDFDNISDKQTDVAPTNGIDNMAPLPLEMTNCGYGFVYPSLVSKERYGWGGNNSPIHGEYHVVKSSNLTGISTSSQGYKWWRNIPVYDRTYINTNGNKWGYYMYFDASDEARRVVSVDFSGNLCTGTRLIFEGYIADVTSGSEHPQVMFRLYGLDSKGNDHLIQSFSSGNLRNNNTSGDKRDTWFQIYGQVTISAVDNVAKYSKFRLSIDNMCTNTNGADYCVDDIHIYMRNAKIDVIQDVPMCPDEDGTAVLNNIRFKLRGDYESLLALAPINNQLFYRICKADGTPLKFDYDDDDDVEDYGVIDLPAAYDASMEMGEKDGGPDQKRFEKDQYGNISLVLANRHFDLEENVKYYVSVSVPDADGNPTQWGTPNDVCTCYSEIYVIAKQTSTVTDANGKIATDIHIDCSSGSVDSYDVTAKIQTIDPVNGGTVTFSGISFDWFCDTDYSTSFNDAEYNSIKLSTALNHFRTVYPTATGIQNASGVFTSDDRSVLNYFIRTKGFLNLNASSKMPEFDGFEDNSGTFKVYAIPIATSTTVGGITYEICPTALVFTFRLSNAGPTVVFGFANVTYPTDEPNRKLRIGKPQLNALTNGGSLTVDVPVHSVTYYDDNHTYTGVQKVSTGAVYVTDTNDPSWDMSERHQVATVTNSGTIKSGDNINLSFIGTEAGNMNEGYWYDLTLTFNAAYKDSSSSSGGVVACPGESTLRFLIVPEYLTWNSYNTSTNNPNWNNDNNWTRSSKDELYKTVYTDYRTDGCYVPMKFSKVVIPTQSGGVYPYLTSILYNAANGIATNLSNIKGEATTYIQYDLMCSWRYDTADGSNDGAGNFSCERFYGNTCDEIYLKPEGEVLYQNYLVYNKAWADREFKAGNWNLASSPLKNTYSGDLYAPKSNGQQTTEAFKPITYSTTLNDRITLPVYQRAWDKSYNEVLADGSTIKAYDYSGTDIVLDEGISAASQQWSHSFNDVTYDFGSTGNAGVGGIAVKVGDDYFFNAGGTALMRLPKADTSYTYYAPDGTMRTSETLAKDSCNRFIVEPKASTTLQYRLTQDNTSNRYFLVGNPFSSTISMYEFINDNEALERKVWIMKNGTLTGCAVPDEGDADYKKNDVLITPMNAFIVKLKDGETPGIINFSPDILAERWISGASTTSNSVDTGTLTITASTGDRESTATVNCRPTASNDYVDSEDVEILDSHLDNTPMVYTVASSKAVSINNTDRIDWLPVGVASCQGTVQLTVSRRGIPTDLYLYDALTRTSKRIEDGETIEVEGNAHGRYFITDTDVNGSVNTDVADQCTVKCYSPERGMLTVKASQPETMMTVSVYDTSGRLMAAEQTDGRIQADFQLTAGVYVVSATLSDGSIRTEKAYVR